MLPHEPDRTDTLDGAIIPVRYRGGGLEPQSYPLAGVIALAAVIIAWQFTAAAMNDFILLPKPGEVWTALAEMWRSGELTLHVGASLRRLSLGWLIGAGLGVATGIAIALHPIIRSATLPLVSILFATPKIALLPLFIVWLGIDEASKIATIAVGVFSPMAVATYAGVDAVDRGFIRMAQSFNLPRWRIVRSILLPGALPSLLTGIRVSASIAVVLLVGAEMIGARYGIGALALNSGSLMRTDRLFAAVAMLGSCGLLISLTVGLAERTLLRWRGA